MAAAKSVHRKRRTLPAVLMRAGTSKGLFIHRSHLPESEKDWAEPLLACMGSRYNDTKQIDGVGGATSVTSKVAVVAPSTRPGIHVDYTFVQVAIGSEKIDLSGNCGNMCSGVGPFAIQEGLVVAPAGARSVDVRIFNTNTERVIVETVEVDEHGEVQEDGEYHIPGVRGPGSEIRVAFVAPAGSMTGVLFPSGRRMERIDVPAMHGLEPFSVDATLIDAANPFVVVDASTLPLAVQSAPQESALSLDVAEALRRHGAVRMGLAADVETAGLVRGTPKMAYVSPSTEAHIKVQAYSMGKPHPSLQLTGGVCMGSAVSVQGTVAHRLAHPAAGLPTPQRTPSPTLRDAEAPGKAVATERKHLKIEHSSGVMEVEVEMSTDGSDVVIEQCVLSRTARRLFEGNVFYYT